MVRLHKLIAGVVVESEDMSARPPAVRTNMIVPSPSEHSAVFLTGTDHSVSTSVGPSRHHRSPENLTSAPSSPRLQTGEWTFVQVALCPFILISRALYTGTDHMTGLLSRFPSSINLEFFVSHIDE